jgi:hypothetical protein
MNSQQSITFAPSIEKSYHDPCRFSKNSAAGALSASSATPMREKLP